MEAFNPALFNPQWIHSTPDSAVQNAHDQSTSAPTQNGHGSPDDWSKPIDLSEFGLGDLQASTSGSSSIAPVQLYQFPPMSQNGHPYYPTVAPFNMVSYGQAAAAAAWPRQDLPLSSYSTLNGATSSANLTLQQQQQQQQQHQQPSSQPSTPVQSMMIDPALTVNGSSSNSNPSYSPPPASSPPTQRSPTSAFINHFQQPQAQQPVAMSPMYMQHQHVQQQQRTLNPQQLNMGYPHYIYHNMPPHVPIPPQTSAQTNLTASSSTQVATPPVAPASVPVPAPSKPSQTPAERRTAFHSKVKTLVAPTALTGAGAVKELVTVISDYGSAQVEPSVRTQIASKIRDNAGNAFFRAWSENEDAMALLTNWLKAAVSGKDDGLWEPTIMPLLHILDRLPLNVAQLANYRVGKIITKILQKPNGAITPAIKDMASNVERKWRTLLEESSSKKAEIEDKTKKRKLSDATLAKSAPPMKKVNVSSSSTSSGLAQGKVKKEKVVAVKDARADASFFSAPKPKPKLPSFKKAAAPSVGSASSAVAAAATNIAQPSAINPFEEVLKSMTKGRPSSASSATPEPGPANSGSGFVSGVGLSGEDKLTKNGKKRKSVTWAPEGLLEKIRFIEKAVYDDDPADGSQSAHSIRDLERAEGAAMHITLFEESIDWYEPQAIEFPEDINAQERGAESLERGTQEERERGALVTLYLTPAHIPDSPIEPANQITVDQVDRDVRMMIAGADVQPFFQHVMSVSDLVGQLAAGDTLSASGLGAGIGAGLGEYPGVVNMNMMPSTDVTMGDVSGGSVANPFESVDLRKLGLDPSALSSLAAQLGVLPGFNLNTGADGSGSGSVDPGAAAYAQQGAQGWSAYSQLNQQQLQHPQQQQQQSYADYGYDEREREEREAPRGGRGGSRGRGRGGRSRGGGGGGGDRDFKSRRRQCNFYAQGSCKFGDQCHFSHDGPPGQGYYE